MAREWDDVKGDGACDAMAPTVRRPDMTTMDVHFTIPMDECPQLLSRLGKTLTQLGNELRGSEVTIVLRPR